MAKIVSLINMKGGVGKSTLTVNLAWFVAEYFYNKKVLIVDLDPQFNASPAPTPIALQSAIVNRAKTPKGSKIDIIPSQLELAFSLLNPSHKETLIADTIQPILADYDLILIDCAPTESVLTLAAYFASDYLLVPVKPEYLSTIGLPLLVNSMSTFRQRYPNRSLQLAGVVFNATTDYAPEEVRAKQEVRQVAQQHNWYVFQTEVPNSRSFPKGAREGMPLHHTSHHRQRPVRQFLQFTEEFLKRIGL